MNNGAFQNKNKRPQRLLGEGKKQEEKNSKEIKKEKTTPKKLKIPPEWKL